MLTPIVEGKKDIKDNHICQRTTHSPYRLSAVMSFSFHHRVPDLLEALVQFDDWAQSPAQHKFCCVTRNVHRIALLTKRDCTHRFYPVPAACTE